jgi:hypothetical protein
MDVEYRVTAKDYRDFFRYNAFRRGIGWKFAGIGLVIVGYGTTTLHFSWGLFLLNSLLIAVVLFLCISGIPYIIALLDSRKGLKQLEGTGLRRRIELTGDGFLVQPVVETGAEIGTETGLETEVGAEMGTQAEKEKKFKRWAEVKFVGAGGKYVFIFLIQGGVYLIPKSCFRSAEEMNHFVFILEAGMEKVRGSKHRRGKKLYPWGFLGLIPNVGAIAGLVLFFRGVFQYKDKTLVIIGLSDILFTIVFWFAMDHWVFNGAPFRQLNKQLSQEQLNNIFKFVEFYKLGHGHYPDSLAEIKDRNSMIWFTDPLQNNGLGSKSGNFYYQRVGEKYWLFSVGVDGKPFTKDDFYPSMNPADSGKFGLMIR